ncbi:condensation domain-containing protein [Variovorax sp. J22P271]|uniref:condensation domain-containing protein n=1 Tax=Variovorax davisae TaxID=3053515 RepID=UPI002578DBEF|nr:condensation domain-containing protein [Variovorax sp. J22P271]MDM0030594.1 condensation domain-containing protein [Variovorax sp. J22P271]
MTALAAAASGPLPIREHPTSNHISFNQEQICLLEAFYPNKGAYNALTKIHIQGRLDVNCLEKAVTHIVGRHEMLRTTIALETDGFRANVHPHHTVNISIDDLSALPEKAQLQAFDECFRRALARRFRVEQLPLFEICAIKFGPEAWKLIQVEHHAVHDGWSFGRLWTEIQTAYNAFDSGDKPSLPALPTQYQQFVHWQRERLAGSYGTAALEFWCSYLAEFDHHRVVTVSSKSQRQGKISNFTTEVSESHCVRVELAARKLGVSAFVLMFSTFILLLAHRTAQEELTVGTAVSARTEPDLEPLIGMIVNTLPIRVSLGHDRSIRTTCRLVQTSLFKSLRYPDVPLSLIVRRLGLTETRGRNPVFQQCFSFHDSVIPRIELNGATGLIEEEHNCVSKFDINVVAIPPNIARGTKSMRMFWQFAEGLLSESECVRFADEYAALLVQVVASA